jgi:hypothetical protein
MQPIYSPEAPKKDNSTLPIVLVAGAVVLCVCAIGGLVLVGGFAYFNSTAISQNRVPMIYQRPTAIVGPGPTVAVYGDPNVAGTIDDGEVRTTLDIPDGGTSHVQPGTFVQYTSNPPSSGAHYSQPLSAGFYDNAVPDGHIVHSLEHGYVVIWYNCDGLSDDDCQVLKDQIKNLMSYVGGSKLIGMNRTGNMKHLIALTSWGKLAFLDAFDDVFIKSFIATNKLHSPEPSGP